ncbi:hypothetical protein [Kluyvera sichuanensis]|uniref:hypothetical protein n=1 Tax=Kluyvera sichuanensis TaxID=2725494 RepID=UPI002FD45139
MLSQLTRRIHNKLIEALKICAASEDSYLQSLADSEALVDGHHCENVMFSLLGSASKEGFFGLDRLRRFLPTDDF